MGAEGLTRARAFRTTHGATVAPDGSSVAYLVDEGGGPYAVQRFLTDWRAGDVRRVRLPVDGPVTKIRYSEHGNVLALEVAPGHGTRTEVWLVTSDPADSSARLMSAPADATVRLVGFSGGYLLLTARLPGGVDESRIVDPRTGRHVVVDGLPEHELMDALDDRVLIRAGQRGRRGLLLRRMSAERGRVGTCLSEHRVAPWSGDADSWPGRLIRDDWTRSTGGARMLVRSEAGSDAARLVESDLHADGTWSVREVAALAGSELDHFELSEDAGCAVLLFNRAGFTEVRPYDVAGLEVGDPIDVGDVVATEPSLDFSGRRVALTIQGPGLPATVILHDRETGETVHLDRERFAGEPDASLAPRRRWTETRDGAQVESLVYDPLPPAGAVAAGATPADENSPAPTILWFHGGPEWQSRPVHDPMVEGLRRAGFRLVLPNVRGSTGYGRAFARADDVELRGTSIEDALDVAEDLVASGAASRSTLFCAGRSYGGYLTNCLMAMHPGVFAAGVAVCGMSDFRAFYVETEPWIATAAYSKYGHPVDDAEVLARWSPLRLADQVASPLLAIHGARDGNVVPAESRRMIRAVLAAGGCAAMMEFPDEGHEILRSHNIDRMIAGMSMWFGDVIAGRCPDLASKGLGCMVDVGEAAPRQSGVEPTSNGRGHRAPETEDGHGR
ncbi:S9 family peptidase [Corynebacterium xerosis]|uniref:S9 family peptidase n=1 Tax=Corynebacterium xerosis TaxID=1725 RepID=A0A2N6SY69_9CORY|nr:prolyl oligopeptidase family serine peptidase [Corynebacterium xerosis]PMC62003.1 S9 family peptidase [Corynebacterium xerosis]